jgi:3'-phosphoadenosine 5'-phosphosulfate sulfotransferase (PAPS reductase)/FAD synthetase
MIVASVSWGNDSVALVQWLAENRPNEDVTCVYADTEWSREDWPARVERLEVWATGLGFKTARVRGVGFVQLARKKKAFPRQGMQFCTSELKIRPFVEWLDRWDTAKEATVACGIRRDESIARSQWPEHVAESERHGGRDAWFPLVRHTREMRDALLARAGCTPLPHRSKECYPCVNANRTDLRALALDPKRVEEIAALEAEIGQNVFRAHKHGGADGIREIVRWAASGPGQYDPDQMGLWGAACDSGMCGD